MLMRILPLDRFDITGDALPTPRRLDAAAAAAVYVKMHGGPRLAPGYFPCHSRPPRLRILPISGRAIYI